MKAEPVPGIEATPDESNARYFHVVVVGPKDVSILQSAVRILAKMMVHFICVTNETKLHWILVFPDMHSFFDKDVITLMAM